MPIKLEPKASIEETLVHYAQFHGVDVDRMWGMTLLEFTEAAQPHPRIYDDDGMPSTLDARGRPLGEREDDGAAVLCDDGRIER